MEAGGEKKMLVAGCAFLATGLLWLGMGVPSGIGVTRAERAAREAALRPLYASEVPKDRSEVKAFVAACNLADRAERKRLRELAEHEDPLVAGNAIGALGRLDEVAGDPGLVAKLKDPRMRVRHEVIAALGKSSDRTAARHLVPLLRSEDAQARLLAIQGLAQLGETGPLDELLRDPATDARTRAFVQAAQNTPRVPEILATTAGLQGQ